MDPTAVLLAVITATAAPQPAAPAPLSLTVSGGVSLGAYEAGFLYYALEFIKANPERVELKLVTGSSAGSINGLLAVVAGCGAAESDPTESLFWRMWIPMGLEQLHVRQDVTAVSVLSRRSFDAAIASVEEAWKAGLAERCDVVLGVSTTRLVPRAVRLIADRLEIPRVEEKFAVRIQGRGKGRPPRATNYLEAEPALPQPLLPVGRDREVPFDAIRDLILASAAFPIAFPPQPLAHCITEPGTPLQDCTRERARTDPFFDGSVLDGRPLRLAERLAGAGLRTGADGWTTWIESPRLGAAPPPSMLFGFVDPDATEYPSAEATRPRAPTESLLGLLGQLGDSWIAGARSKELYTLLEDQPGLAARIRMPRRHFPAAGDPLADFFGFLETDFRIFDFYLGMYDARRMFLESSGQPAGARSPPRLPEPTGLEASPPGWRHFACLRGVLDGVEALLPACAGEGLTNFRALAQVSLDRLHDACERANGGERDAERQACARAGSGEPAVVPGVTVAKPGGWRRGRDESDLAHVTRLLAARRFTFRDLGLGPDEGDRALRRVRVRLGELADEVAARQSLGEGTLLAMAARPAVDLLSYAPPRHLLYLALGRVVEIGYSASDPESRWFPSWLRLALAAQLYGMPAALSSERKFFGAAGLAGLEFQLPVTGASVVQVRMALRGGYLLASGDHYLQAPCAYGDGTVDRIGRCSGPVFDVNLSATVLERLRFQLLAQWFPAVRAGDVGLWAISPGAGLQVSF